jgi:hypothetical protein
MCIHGNDFKLPKKNHFVTNDRLLISTGFCLQFLFNGADSNTIAFINRYYGFHIREVPVSISSSVWLHACSVDFKSLHSEATNMKEMLL